MSAEKTISVVCPVFNEEEGIYEFYERTSTALRAIEPAIDYELLFVNDGSRDGTSSILHKIAETDRHVGVMEFSRNFGHQIAITAGIDAAAGDAVVVIDSDLQDPPEVIASMVAKWREGFDVVYGQRSARPGESRFKLFTARAFYRLINWMSDVDLPLDAGDFRLIDRKVVEALRQIREENRYVRGLISWVGFRQYALLYERDERFAGETKYPLRKMLKFAADGISSFSDKPLRMATQLGGLVTLTSFLMVAYIIVGKIMNPDGQLPGYASMMAVILLLGGIQLMFIGVLGQYLGRTYQETKRRPLYIVADHLQSAARSAQLAAPKAAISANSGVAPVAAAEELSTEPTLEPWRTPSASRSSEASGSAGGRGER